MASMFPTPHHKPDGLDPHDDTESLEAIMRRVGKTFFPDSDVSTIQAVDPDPVPSVPPSVTVVPPEAPAVAPPPREGGFQRLGTVLDGLMASPSSLVAAVAPPGTPLQLQAARPAPVALREPRTRAQRKLREAADAIRREPAHSEVAFIARQLIQATLPHKNPGDVPLWKRTNGNLTLGIQPGVDLSTGKSYGYPYGILPRLLLFWLTTEALRTHSPRLELSQSLAVFMQQLGLDPSRGGPRSDARRLRAQMDKLFHARISFESKITQGGRDGVARFNMLVASKTMLWWNPREPQQGALWGSWIELGQDFYQAILASPVPTDMRVLQALKKSPLALDLYAWATYTAFHTQRTGQPRSVSWQLLHRQFGAEYKDMKEFARKGWAAFRKILAVYPELAIARVYGGVKVWPCQPSIPMRPPQDVNAE